MRLDLKHTFSIKEALQTFLCLKREKKICLGDWVGDIGRKLQRKEKGSVLGC
jgi:hypothetical protein